VNINPYKTLGVGEKATQDEIKKAYKKLAMKYHPDKNPDNKKAEEEFKKVNEAYQMIGSEDARKKYDNGGFDPNQFAGAGGFGGQAGGFSQGFHFSFEDLENDLFDSLFGFNRGQQRRGGFQFGGRQQNMKGQDLHFKMNIEMMDSLRGGNRVVSLPDGRQLDIAIPVGIKSGQKLRMKGQGSPGFQKGQEGDLMIEINVNEDPQIKREGDDLYITAELPLNLAVQGGQWKVFAPTGTFDLTVPAWTDSGKKFRLKGKGVAGRGDLYVLAEVHLPKIRDLCLEEYFKNTLSAES